MATTTVAARKSKKLWHPPPPPTPRILHLPRRTKTSSSSHSRRRSQQPMKSNSNPTPQAGRRLESLFDEERAFSSPPVVLLERRRSRESGVGIEERERSRESEEEGWRFQAEMLRAECNLLRKEREIYVKKMERERSSVEQCLKSSVRALLSGKKKIREGEGVSTVLEAEIEELAKKLVELQKNSRMTAPELRNCSNFDKQASLLQKQLEKFGEMTSDNNCLLEEGSEFSPNNAEHKRDRRSKGFGSSRGVNKFVDVETLRRKMEGLSKGHLLKRMEEEYGFMLSASANCSAPGSASTSRRYELSDLSAFAARQSSQEPKSGDLRACSGHCKAIVRKIMEQARAETEQWSQMQEMLGQVREEMEELQASRDFWEQKALQSDHRIQSLGSEVMTLDKNLTPMSLGAQLANEKRVLQGRVRDSATTSDRKKEPLFDLGDGKKERKIRQPFREVGNTSPLVRQNSRKYVYPLHMQS